MFITNKQSSCKFVTKTVMAAQSRSLMSAMIVIMVAAIFALLCGILASLLHVGGWPVGTMASYFALWGAAAGALVGGFAKAIDAISIDGSPRGIVRVRSSNNGCSVAELCTRKQAVKGQGEYAVDGRTLLLGATSMRSSPLAPNVAAASRGVLVGAICGVLLTALGSLMSSSPLGIGATVVVASALGACMDRLSGTIVGAICGVLLAALGSLLSSSILGILTTIVGCTLLGGWLAWVLE